MQIVSSPNAQNHPDSQGDHASCRPSWDTSGIQGAEGQVGRATEKGTLPEEPGQMVIPIIKHIQIHQYIEHLRPMHPS